MSCEWQSPDLWRPEMVSLMYGDRGWDLETGWPYRETCEKYGLKDVAGAMERLDLLPEHPAPDAPPWRVGSARERKH